MDNLQLLSGFVFLIAIICRHCVMVLFFYAVTAIL